MQEKKISIERMRFQEGNVFVTEGRTYSKGMKYFIIALLCLSVVVACVLFFPTTYLIDNETEVFANLPFMSGYIGLVVVAGLSIKKWTEDNSPIWYEYGTVSPNGDIVQNLIKHLSDESKEKK
jgi:hypothetical protein